MTVLRLALSGDSFAMGWQHGRQIQHLRSQLLQVIDARLSHLRRLDADRSAVIQPCLELLDAVDRPLLQYLDGVAAALEFDRTQLLRYTLSSYLRDMHAVRNAADSHPTGVLAAGPPREGCTTWAAAGQTTADGRPLLAKNRDYHADHIALQVLAHVQPGDGYRYLSLGSAGSPEVFSSGINERGLAVADTHVLSKDIGPGLPRFSLMREILTHHDTVASALDYLRAVPHMGAGTLLLADAAGRLALCESGHSQCGFVAGGSRVPLVSTNHFTTPALAQQWIEDEPALLRGNSPARRQRVMAALDADAGVIDVAWAQRMMAAHGTAQDAVCRHPLAGRDGALAGLDGSTIASVILQPRGHDPDGAASMPALWLAIGTPCQGEWQQWSAAG